MVEFKVSYSQVKLVCGKNCKLKCPEEPNLFLKVESSGVDEVHKERIGDRGNRRMDVGSHNIYIQH